MHIIKFYIRLVPHFLEFMHYDRCVVGLSANLNFTLRSHVRKILSGERARTRICGLSARQRNMFAMYCEHINVMTEGCLIIPQLKCVSCHGFGYVNHELCVDCDAIGSHDSVVDIIISKLK